MVPEERLPGRREKSGDTKVCMSMGFAYGFEFYFYHIGDIGEAYIVLCSRFHMISLLVEAQSRSATTPGD